MSNLNARLAAIGSELQRRFEEEFPINTRVEVRDIFQSGSPWIPGWIFSYNLNGAVIVTDDADRFPASRDEIRPLRLRGPKSPATIKRSSVIRPPKRRSTFKGLGGHRKTKRRFN